ncbi:interferon-induced protein 44-like isoform X1 [Polypterus senegalus]|uniref:interferon-induced protein 44-like isoform X1 n=1 Tax=Polypterus senegalus TaxID=55291 RepID=UPI00196347E1|nr:interferon-induced protein 44-like isoform X1 [Polypterus senegalus]XP_039591542.1 interferon-induced protein 44-like isoform X1 [Polypterus senegalus]
MGGGESKAEVYKATSPPPPPPLLEKPWREQEFSSRIRNELLEEIRNYKTLTESVEEPRILLVGQITAGKSSFFNSLNSVFRGHVMLQAASGYGDTSVSKQYRTYTVLDGKDGRKLPFILCDTMGLESNQQTKKDNNKGHVPHMNEYRTYPVHDRKDGSEDSGSFKGILVEDIISVIKGHVPDLYEFNPKAPITRNDRRYREDPRLADKVHCVVYVFDANTVSLLNQNQLKKFKSIRAEVNNMGIPLLVLVTKIDEACLEVTKDLTKVYWSRYLYQKVTQLGQVLGVPISSISPVKNYSIETELNLHVDVLILTALQQMLRAADACFDDMKLKGLAQRRSS